jgi:hypothetical protein
MNSRVCRRQKRCKMTWTMDIGNNSYQMNGTMREMNTDVGYNTGYITVITTRI